MKRDVLCLLGAVTLAGAGAALVPGCAKEGPFESAGESVDDAVNDAGDAIESAGENVGDAVNDAGDAIEDAGDDVGDALDDKGG